MKFSYMPQDSSMQNFLWCTIAQKSVQTFYFPSTVNETTTHETTTRSVLQP